MRRLLCTAIAALALSLLAGCTSLSGGSDEGSAAGGGGEAADAVAAPGDPGEPDPDRQVVTTASASLAVEDPAAAAQRVSELVESSGGRVDERTEQAASGEDDGATADLVVRVPATELTGVLADLEDLGDIETVSVSRSDQTAAAVDLDARISALQSSVARLQGLMDDAPTTDALLKAETALSERQEQLESLQSKRASLADQVELSTLSVHLEPFGVAPAGGPDGFGDGLGTGWRALTSALGAAVVVLGVLLPWLALAALVAVGVLVPLRLVRRRAAVRTASSSASDG
jgi:hypothetical protein